MADLNGMRIALLEGRMSSEMAGLVRRHGGEPYCVQAVRETPLECGPQVAAFINHLTANHLTAGALPFVVFLTGAGVNALVQEADRLGRLPELLDALRGVTTICRGPKPAAALRRQGVPVAVNVPEPHTVTELIMTLQTLDLAGKGVGVVHYGERNEALAAAIRSGGAALRELCLYQWQLPDDLEPLRLLVRDVLDGSVDAIAFTSQVQARHLFAVAAMMGEADALACALRRRTLTAAIGPTCAEALRGFGVDPHVMPVHPKMGHLVLALVRHVDASEGAALAARG